MSILKTFISFPVKVSNVKVNTVKEVYYPGEQINCTAEGNPSPQFTWKPQGAPDRDEVSGPVLTVTREMLGENQWICVARNVIDGKEITNETPVIAFKVCEFSMSLVYYSMLLSARANPLSL